MRITAKIEYACKALLELSLHWPDQHPLSLTVVAHKQGIPLKFLTHILLQLKQLGYVQSVRGKTGGYYLLKSPKDIFLSDIVRQFGGVHMDTYNDPVFEDIWKEVDDAWTQQLRNYTFDVIKERYLNEKQNPLYAI